MLKADIERKKQEREERKKREAEEAAQSSMCAEQANLLRPYIGRLVQYYHDGWRAGTLVSFSKRNTDARIEPIKSKWASLQPRDAIISVFDIRGVE